MRNHSDAFQTLYESATGYGLRKALNTKKDELEGQKREIDLEKQIEESHNEIEKLKGLSKQPWLYIISGHTAKIIFRTYWCTQKSRNTRA